MNTDYEKQIVSTERFLKLIDQALIKKNGFSISRFGIGELTCLVSHTTPVLMQHFEQFMVYAGITCSPEKIRQELLLALKSANVVGLIPSWKLGFWADITKKILSETNFKPNLVCCAWILNDIVSKGFFWPWIKDKNIVIVGRRSSHAIPVFEKQGVEVSAAINLEGYNEINYVHDELRMLEPWDVAIISAGIPATILAPRIAKATGKVAIDFGHALDILIDGENYDHLQLVKRYNKTI